MKAPRERSTQNQHTITCSDEDWDLINAGAAQRDKSASAWFVECALTVDVRPRTTTSWPLVLDAGEQRSMSRDAAESARGSHPNAAGTSRLADDLRAVFEGRLRAMAREGRRDEAIEALRTVIGEDRAAIVVAAIIPDTMTTPGSQERPKGTDTKSASDRQSPQQLELPGISD